MLTPVMTYWTYSFFKHHNHPILRKRMPKVTLFIAILLIISNFYGVYNAANLIIPNSFIYHYDIQYLGSYLYYPYTFCYCARFWYFFYDIHYIQITVNSKWYAIINSNFMETEEYRSKFKRMQNGSNLFTTPQSSNSGISNTNTNNHSRKGRDRNKKNKKNKKHKQKRKPRKKSPRMRDIQESSNHFSIQNDSGSAPSVISSSVVIHSKSNNININIDKSKESDEISSKDGTSSSAARKNTLLENYFWFIQNRKTLGRPNYILKIAAFLGFFISTIDAGNWLAVYVSILLLFCIFFCLFFAICFCTRVKG